MGRVAAASGAAEDLHDYLAILAQLEEVHAGASVVILHACGLLSPAHHCRTKESRGRQVREMGEDVKMTKGKVTYWDEGLSILVIICRQPNT